MNFLMRLPENFKEHQNPQLFEKLKESSLEKLLQHSVIQDYESGRLLVQQGDKPEYIYLVISGVLKTFRIDAEEGREATIRMLQSGDTCMEAVLFMGGPSPINVQTVNQSKVLQLPERIVKQHALDDAQFAMNLLRIVTRHYKNAMHQIEAMNIKSPLQRVGYYFLLKHLDAGHDNLEFELPFQKQMIANYLGMTPETFSRTLKQMKGLGIEIEGEKIKMRDAFSLCHFCDSDTASICDNHDKGSCKACPLH
ncbi:MAG: Crp/Fnr family transcriptional regulator [Alphaproteobacteria bacterium]|nr:Crp/Fnr family transcriptional regulator [Alphaproteobacteria bacterium]MCB1550716.1 Crp/Fnr family transcriptional regulator [Alphaproteobacteria bacterium]MCB9984701.1 Crp/Fnr family transcriptional regulator [Micavibrio sp.]